MPKPVRSRNDVLRELMQLRAAYFARGGVVHRYPRSYSMPRDEATAQHKDAAEQAKQRAFEMRRWLHGTSQ